MALTTEAKKVKKTSKKGCIQEIQVKSKDLIQDRKKANNLLDILAGFQVICCPQIVSGHWPGVTRAWKAQQALRLEVRPTIYTTAGAAVLDHKFSSQRS